MTENKIDPENEEELIEAVADDQSAEGFSASSQDTGGGIIPN
jgi:hypothetical protein